MARIDTLPNFLTDVATAIRNKTGESELLAPEDYDTEIESIQGGGYSGPLPSSTIMSSIVCEGSNIKIKLITDDLASGTRIYYKEGELPSTSDSYIDVPKNTDVAIIPNVNMNSMYGIKSESYIIYDENKKAFNNSISYGTTALKMTMHYNSAGAVLLDLPEEVQGNAATFTTYSTYTNTFYLGIAGKLYKLDCNVEMPQFVRIGSDQTFSSNMRMTPTDQGLFIQGSSVWLLYNEQTGSWGNIGKSINGYIEVLSNEDIFFNDGQYGNGMLYLYNKQTKVLDKFNGGKYKCNDNWYIDDGSTIYISTFYNSNKTGFEIYKYNADTSQYDLVGVNTTASLSSVTRCLMGIKQYTNVLLAQVNNCLYYLKDGVFTVIDLPLSSYNSPFYRSASNRYMPNCGIVQDPNNTNIFYITFHAGYYGYGAYFYKVNIDTNELEQLWYVHDSSYYNYLDSAIAFFDNKAITKRGYYDTINNEYVSKSITGMLYDESIIEKNGKLYSIGTSVYKWNSENIDFTLIGNINGASGYVRFIDNGDKIYIYNNSIQTGTSVCGIYVLDTINDTLTQITNISYNNAVIINNKAFFRGSSGVKQFIVDLENDTYSFSDYYCGNGFSYIFNTVEGGANSTIAAKPDDSIRVAEIQLIETMYHNKIIYGLDKELLDLSISDKTYTLKQSEWYMYNYIYKGTCYQSNDYSNIVVLFTPQNNS